MNHREESKKRFRENQTEQFMRLIHRYPKLAESLPWNEIADEYMKVLLRGRALQEYLDEIFALLDEVIDKGHLPRVAGIVFAYWCTKVEDDLRDRVRQREYSAYQAKSVKGIFEGHRKTIKPELQKYIDAYKVFKNLSEQFDFEISSETGLAGYLENNDNSRTEPGFDALGKMLKSILAGNPSLSIEVKTGDDLNERHGSAFRDFLEVRLNTILPNDEQKKLYFRFQNEGTTLADIVRNLERSVVDYAEKKFGEEGRLIADILIDGRKPEEVENEWIRPRTRPKGRPKEVQIDTMILYLNELGIDELWIARFINALENRERYKLASKDPEWSVRKRKVMLLSESKVRKAIRSRISKLGGNTLRFRTDLLIKERGECPKCEWKWNESGVLIRLPCRHHTDAPKEIGVTKEPNGWRAFLERKELELYSNSLTFVGEKKSQMSKTNKSD